jgi:uncharacterized membrane protein
VPTNRLEAFSDGVIAILITIMVLGLKAPDKDSLDALSKLLSVFLAYVLSFVYLGIYWNNHHHMIQTTERVTGAMLWANLHLLFWLSLFPTATSWMGQHHTSAVPAAVYGTVMLGAAIAYYVLQLTIVSDQGRDGLLATALGRDAKGKVSPLLYATAIALAFVSTWLSIALYVVVALIWLVPDKRLERVLLTGESSSP